MAGICHCGLVAIAAVAYGYIFFVSERELAPEEVLAMHAFLQARDDAG